METSIEKTQSNALAMKFSSEEIKLLKTTVAPGLNDSEFKVFMVMCERTRLDPFRRQIYAVKRGERMVVQTGIDGYRAIAARTGQYAGNDDAIFDSELQPKKATVTVYRFVNGTRCPFSASARWDQYYPGDKLGFQWKKMPHVMLAKCAEAQALRKAFPEDLSGLYTEEEMEHSANSSAPISAISSPAVEYESDLPPPPSEEDENVPIQEMRAAILNSLIGKGKPFGSKVNEAKAWVYQQTETDIMNLSADQCIELEDRIKEEFQNAKL